MEPQEQGQGYLKRLYIGRHFIGLSKAPFKFSRWPKISSIGWAIIWGHYELRFWYVPAPTPASEAEQQRGGKW